jgi:hypothetical protein
VQQFGHDITTEKAQDPSFAVNYAAWRMSGGIRAYGSLNAWYLGQGGNGKPRGYNPGFGGNDVGDGPEAVFKLAKVPNYQPTLPPSPTETAGTAVDTAGAKKTITDPWFVVKHDAAGRVTGLGKVYSAVPPDNVLKFGPTPITQSAFIQLWKQGTNGNPGYGDIFFAYTGRQASGKEIAGILSKGTSLYTLTNALANAPAFVHSPTYKSHAPGVVAIAKGVLGQDWKVDKQFVKDAIVQNWDQATLEANIRQRPEYESGPEFKDTVAKFSTVYGKIYGQPDANANDYLKQAAKAGWTPDQLGLALRSAPEYKNSEEYKSWAMSFAQQIGLLTGHTPSLTLDQASLGGAPQFPGRDLTPAEKDAANVPPTVTGTYTRATPSPPAISGEPKNQPPFTRHY